MGMVTDSIVLDLAAGIILVLYLIYKYWTRKYSYWERRGVAYVKPEFPLGTLKINLLDDKPHYGLLDKRIYDRFKKEKYVGIFALTEPELFIIDLDVVKQIFTKDFNHFVDRGMFACSKEDICAHHLFNIEGDYWKRMRAKLTPTFTSGRLKNMFLLMEVIAVQLKDHVEELVEEKKNTVNIKDLIAKFTIDIIATCAFGVEVNTLKNPDNVMRNVALVNIEPSSIKYVKQFILQHIHWLAKFLKITQVRPQVSSFCLNLLKDTMEYRKKHNVSRNDFIDLLTGIKNRTLPVDKEDDVKVTETVKQTKDIEELTLEEMAAQVFVFFAAGFDTASSTSSFLLYELSQNKEIQDLVREEIDTVLRENDGKLNYQSLPEFIYLEQCINETLRRYASVPFLRRRCTSTYTFPDTGLVVEKGTMITIPSYAIHHDPDVYPDPYKFNPDRFSEENVRARHAYAFLPFGEGPRVCIGKRFGMMQVKMAIVTLLRDFEVSPAPGLPKVLRIDHKPILTASAVPIRLVITKRKIS